MSSTPNTSVSIDASKSNLFKPLKVGNVELSNRLVYAPSTRLRCTEDGTPTDSMLEYYRRRAEDNGGLLIFEATSPHPSMGILKHSPMLHTKKQIAAFKKITDAVHKEGSHIAVQLWSAGRVADPVASKKAGYPLLAPSAIYLDEASKKNAIAAGNELQEMTVHDIKDVVQHFVDGSKRAIEEAGFDFVEIHGAHGFLVDAFLQESANQRTDEYGGSVENRARFLLEVVDAIVDAVGAEHVAIRLSPYAVVQGSEGIHSKINPIVQWGYILSELQRRADDGKSLAYLSVVEPRVSGVDDNKEAENVDMSWIQMIWRGPIITAGNHLDKRFVDRLSSVVDRDDRTLIGVSRYFTSNPDLAHRLKKGLELTPYHRETFYLPGSNVGYLNFTKYGEEEDNSQADVKPVPLA